MGHITAISRRAFLVGSAALTGGVAFGSWSFAQDAVPDAPNPLLPGLGPNAATFNPWVKISPDRITLITPHADVGQGVVSSQAILIAEEMDLDLGQFETEFGPPSAAYWNTGLVNEFVPFTETDHSPAAEAARQGARKYLKEAGLQITGGSSTVPDSYEKLRMAGAVARETLKAAAAKRSGVALADIRTQSGQVILPDGTKIPYGQLAAEAAQLPPVQNVTLRAPSQWRLIGKPMERVDIKAKATGALKFGIDQTVEGMVFAAVKLNPYKGGALTAFDAGAAQAMPGVKKVLKISNGIAVIASNSWYAMQAVDAVDCTWAKGNYPPEQAEHWAAVAASFNPAKVDKEWRNEGDIAAALKDAAVIESEYRAPYVAHQPLEPLNAIAVVRDDAAEIWVGHQMPRIVQSMVATLTGLKPEQVVFHNQWSGGSFGHRLEFENVRTVIEIAREMRGTPVKVVFSREEDFLQDFPRQIAMARNRGVVKDGKIIAADMHFASASAVRSQFGRLGMQSQGPDTQIPAGIWNMTYAIPNYRATTYAVDGVSPTSSWRSVGASTGGFFAECFIDELIHAAGLDPLKARIDMSTVDVYRKVLEAVGEMSDWKGPLGNGKGRGVAFMEAFGVPIAEVVEVSATDKGIRIDKIWIAAEVGKVVDPVNFENLVQGGVVWGLGHAINCELTYSQGAAQQTNYTSHEGMRMYQCPPIAVRGLENGADIHGIGEPPTAISPPALANAIFAATGKRLREMPFNKFIDFV